MNWEFHHKIFRKTNKAIEANFKLLIIKKIFYRNACGQFINIFLTIYNGLFWFSICYINAFERIMRLFSSEFSIMFIINQFSIYTHLYYVLIFVFNRFFFMIFWNFVWFFLCIYRDNDEMQCFNWFYNFIKVLKICARKIFYLDAFFFVWVFMFTVNMPFLIILSKSAFQGILFDRICTVQTLGQVDTVSLYLDECLSVRHRHVFKWCWEIKIFFSTWP